LGFAAAPALARGDDAWVLTTADFRSERVGLRAIDATGATVSNAGDGQNRLVAFERLLMIERLGRSASAPPPAQTTQMTPAMPGGGFVVITEGGRARAVGTPQSLAGDELVWENPTVGELRLPLRSVVAIVSRGQQQQPQQQQHLEDALAAGGAANQRSEDVVTLGNADVVRGIISGVTGSRVSVQQTDGQTIDVPLETVARITFASTGATSFATANSDSRSAARQRAFCVGLADGSFVVAHSVRLSGEKVTIELSEGSVPRTIALAAVTSVEQINGPVIWASALPMSDPVQRPLFDLSWPARTDRSVDGEPIRVGDRTFARGIGVHSYSRLSFALDPAWRAFRTQYAIAGEWPYANVTVRIKLDDRVVHERSDVRSGTLAQPVLIELSGGEMLLTLEVDYGKNYDVQDRFNWIEPAFLRVRPERPAPPSPAAATLPATMPTTGSTQ
jgi:hypothetical protein